MPLPMLSPSPDRAPAEPRADLRSVPHGPAYEANPDIVTRLRTMDSRTPFARAIIQEAAAEIERLRQAIALHRRQVWGQDEPDHASDSELYKALGPK